MHLKCKSECSRGQQSPQRYLVSPESAGIIRTSALSISAAAIKFLILLRFEGSLLSFYNKTDSALSVFLPPLQLGLTGSFWFQANNAAGRRPLFKRLIGCRLGKEAISEVSVTAENVWKQGKEERPLSRVPTGCGSSIEIAVAFQPGRQSQQRASMGKI